MDPRVADILRAATEVFVPSDETIGAPDVEAERFVAHYLNLIAEGLAAGTAQLLDDIAVQRSGRPFVDLDLDGRTDVLDEIAEHDVAALKQLPAVLGMLTIAAVYGEWTGLGADGVLAHLPVGWELTGFEGPSRARPHLL